MKRLYALLLLLACVSAPLAAQNTLITVQNPDELYVCGTDTLTVSVTNTGGATLSNIVATVTLSAGIEYVPGTVTGATEQNITNLNAPQLAVPSLGVGAVTTFKIAIRADCALVDAINSGQLFNSQIKTTYTGGMDQITTLNYPVETGLLVIVGGVTPFSQAGEKGQVLTRQVKVKNTRLGPIGRIEFSDFHFPGYTGGAPGASSAQNLSPVLFTAVFDGAFFNTVGNLNNTLDFNEEITLVEEVTITDCGIPSFDNPSQIIVGWGCNSDVCQYDSTEAEVTILPSTQNPALTFSADLNVPRDYCSATPTPQEMTITNTGNLPAQNVVVDLYPTAPQGAGIDPASIEYNPGGTGWLPLVPNLTDELILEDCGQTVSSRTLLVVPEVPANSVTTIRFNALFCSPGCEQATSSFFAFTFYNKACPPTAAVSDSLGFQIDTNQLKMDAYVKFRIDSCLEEGTSYAMQYIVKSPRLLTDNGFLQLRLQLPAGILWDESCTPTLGGIAPVYNLITPNTGPTGALTEHLYSFQLPLANDSVAFDFCLKYLCTPGMPCESIDGSWDPDLSNVTVYPNSCDSACGLRTYGNAALAATADAAIGCGLTRCQNFLLFVNDTCSGGGGGGGGGGGAIAGMLVSYQTYRTNFGLLDDDDDRNADDNLPPTLNLIRRDRYLPGDTLRFEMRGVVFEGEVDNIAFKVFTESMSSDFGLADGDPYGIKLGQFGFTHKDSMLVFVGANLHIKKATGEESSCPVAWDPNNYAHQRFLLFQEINIQPPSIIDQMVSLNRKFELSLASCSPDGQPLQVGDSIYFTYDYRFRNNFAPAIGNTGIAPALINFRNSLWRADAEYAWREPAEVLPGPLSQYSGYVRTRTFPRHTIQPCATSFQQNPFAFGVRIARGNLFPYEVRSLAEITRFEYTIPFGAVLNTATTDVTLQENTLWIDDLPTAWTVNGEKHTFDYEPTFDLPVDEGFNLVTNFVYDPSCSFLGPDTTFVDYDVLFPEGFPGNALVNTKRRDVTGMLDALPILQPTFGTTILNLSSPAFTLDFSLKNIRPANAPNAWVYVEPLNGSLEDVELIRLPAGTSLPGLANLFQLGNVLPLANVNLRLKASNSNCEGLKVRMIFGWGCDPTTNPLSSSCGRDTVLLDLRLRNAVLELDILDQPLAVPLCEPSDYFVFEVSNANDGNAFSLTPSVKLPPGLTLIPGSAQIAYPTTGAWTNIPDPDLLAGNIYRWSTTAILPALTNGLPGFPEAPANAFRIRFRVQAECGFVAGAQPIYGVEGRQPCGTFTNILRKPDTKIDLEGVSPTYGVLLNLSPVGPTPVACGQDLEIAVQIQIQGSPSSTDSVYISLPAGVSYVAGSYAPGQNAPAGAPQLFGSTLQLPLPTGLGTGGVVKFNLKVRYDDAAGCIDRFIIAQARQKTTGFCPATNQSCPVYIATGEALLSLPTNNPDLVLSNFTPANATATGFDFTATLNNPGAAPAPGATLQLWLDQNGNGQPDAGEQVLQTVTYNQSIATGGSATLSGSLATSLENLCKLLAVLPADENCACGPKVFPLQNFTVDEGTYARCSVEAVPLGIDSIAGHTYVWQPASQLSCSGCAGTVFNPGPSVQPGDVFTFVLTETAGTCSIQHQFAVSFGGTLGIQGADQVVCRGDTVVIAATPGGSYQWTGPGVNPTSGTQTLSPNQTTTYSVTVTLSAGCTGTDQITVTVLEPTNVDLGVVKTCPGVPVNVFGTPKTDPGTYCINLTKANGCDSTVCLTLQVVPVAGASVASFCTGDSLEVFPGQFVKTAGVYTKTFQNSAGCDSTQTVTVSVVPPVNVALADTVRIAEGTSTTLEGPAGFATYQWSPSEGLSCTDCQNPVASPDTSTTYTLRVTTAEGCEGEVQVRVVVLPPCFEDLYVPNAFTPDGDGLNDVFRVVPREGLEVVSLLQVYNRWGQKIYESATNPTWDGLVDGEPAPVDTYIYILEIVCNGEKRRWEQHEVNLLR